MCEKMTKEQIEKMSFEEALQRLEENVRLLESGSISIDKSLALLRKESHWSSCAIPSSTMPSKRLKYLHQAATGIYTKKK